MKISLENNLCSLTVDSFGGAITNFQLKDDEEINPLNFAFTQEQMPSNNKNGAPYQGHFLCAGRWGLPSEGEIRKGVPNHGEAANSLWETTTKEELIINMQTTAGLEGLHVERRLELDNQYSLFKVEETFTNINSLGRLYNVVQHPTLAAPFLDSKTIINCNATIGFDQSNYKHATEKRVEFPFAKDDKGNTFNLKKPTINYSSVFSFIVDAKNKIGWLTAYSKQHNLLFGYVWKRSDYPWIHLWQHFENDKIKYRGLEFGTAGIHQPFKEILNTATELFGEKTFAYIDAGESVYKKFFSFIYKTGDDFSEIENITFDENNFVMKTTSRKFLKIASSFNLSNELL
ncbi:MAG: hypothetical protein JO072_13765 [Parafilimonas sp.]|nr:hypothetical protein [Parafilimonas sp.]